MNDVFRKFATRASHWVGSARVFMIGILVVLAWLLSGPYYDFSERWQLAINTGTTIVTFLMVFLIQNAQNRHAHTIQLKLNELLAAMEGARTHFVDLEEQPEEELVRLRKEFKAMREELDDFPPSDTHPSPSVQPTT
jgi:low affinity Fe/Cu permease